MKQIKHITITVLVSLCLLVGCCQVDKQGGNDLLILKEQGSFTVGGTVTENPGTYDATKFDNWKPYEEGQTYHGDHAYVFYQIPDNARSLPLVFLHGAGQSSKTWETTVETSRRRVDTYIRGVRNRFSSF